MSLRYPSSDSELTTIVRDETSYEDTQDELPQSQLDTIIERAKGKLEMNTGSTQWYSDNGLGFALAAYTAMRAKSAVENVVIESYALGDQTVRMRNADPETSQQIQQWAEDVSDGLDFSSVDSEQTPLPTNSSDYIGDNYHY